MPFQDEFTKTKKSVSFEFRELIIEK
jgi:hypothetical protein